MKLRIYISLQLLLCVRGTGLLAQDNVEVDDVITGKVEVTARKQIRFSHGFHAVSGSNFHAYLDANAVDNTPTMTAADDIGATAEVTPTSGKNYVKSITFREARQTMPSGSTGNFKHLESIQYFDGLGRPSQTIQVGASPLGKDIVQPIVYDDFGREATKYLPYAKESADGVFNDDAITACETFFNGDVEGKAADSRPFSFTDFENSPLNRVNSQMGAGSAWHDKNQADENKGITRFEYLTNSDPINPWSGFSYPASSLYITETTDENGNISREYKDKLGQVVLKESEEGSETLKTYYIYDDFGLLRTVVPPLAESPADTELCYFYEYDGRKRMISKKIPGAQTVYMVYDQRDRLVLTQDGNMRTINDQGQTVTNTNKYLFTKYDILNRPVMTGTLTATKALSAIRTDFKNHGDVSSEEMYETYNQSANAASYGYTLNDSYPTSCPVVKSNILTVTWYDDYDFLSLPGYSNLAFNQHGSPTGYAAKSDYTKGVATGTMVKALAVANSGLTLANSELVSVSYFDDYGNVIKAVSKNHKGGYDVVHSKYEAITYQVLETVQEHKSSLSTTDLTTVKGYKYDHAGRLLETTCKVNNQATIVMNANKYNELGELISKGLHSEDVSSADKSFVQKVDYTYNIRGWMTSINDPDLSEDGDLFGMKLYYNNVNGLNTDRASAGAQFNGNISAIVCGTAADDVKNRGYGFSYDGINRLKTAKYGEGIALASGQNKYNVTGNDGGIHYDKNGNILNLKRYFNGTSTNNVADDLTYHYETKSNRLSRVEDNSTVGDMADVADFVEKAGNYAYDANGNMIYDPAKEGTVKYNYLNLPEKVILGSKGTIFYHYDAAGNKLAKYTENSSSSENTTTEYIANLVFTNGKKSFFSTEEGRAIPIVENGKTRWHFEYNLKDHLGNTRVTFGGSSIAGAADIVQTSSYYPFGMVMAQQNYNSGGNSYQLNKYLYNGKELQANEFEGASLDWYDYGARFYDASLGRWHAMDPLCQYNSPYIYCGNDPISMVDPTGMWSTDSKDPFDEVRRAKKRSLPGENRITDTKGYTVDKKGNFNQVNDAGGNEYDVLFTKADYEKAMEEAKNNGQKGWPGYVVPNNNIKVSYGTFSEENTYELEFAREFSIYMESPTKGLRIYNEADANSIFKFVADNFQVEWGLVTGDNNGIMTIVATSAMKSELQLSRIALSMIETGYFLLITNHNHPTYNTPSGFFTNGKPIRPYEGDAAAAKFIDKKNGAPVKHYMYHPRSGETTQYNQSRYEKVK